MNFNCIQNFDELKKVPKCLRHLEIKSNPKLTFDTDLIFSLFPDLETLNGIALKEKAKEKPSLPQSSSSTYKAKRNHGGSQSIDSIASNQSIDVHDTKNLVIGLPEN